MPPNVFDCINKQPLSTFLIAKNITQTELDHRHLHEQLPRRLR